MGQIGRVFDEMVHKTFREMFRETRFAISRSKRGRFACFAVSQNGPFRQNMFRKTAKLHHECDGNDGFFTTCDPYMGQTLRKRPMLSSQIDIQNTSFGDSMTNVQMQLDDPCRPQRMMFSSFLWWLLLLCTA